ncbi:MAG: TrmH family RNA methyltransferase [Candidatus Paceibacteria bacterium]
MLGLRAEEAWAESHKTVSAETARLSAELRRLQSRGGRDELNAFSMEGTRLVERALAAEVSLQAALCSESFARSTNQRERKLVDGLQARGVKLHISTDDIVAELVAGRTFGSILAVADYPAPVTLQDLLQPVTNEAPAPAFHPGLLVVIDAADPGNVGALVRTALASGARAFVSVGSTDPFHPKAVRTSMGSIFRLPIQHFANSAAFLESLGTECELCGAVSQGSSPLRKARNLRVASRPIALCVGSEAFGLDEAFQRSLHRSYTIPMPAGVDSLSINAAAAVCLYELLGPS